MNLIKESVWGFLSVKLPIIGAFLLGILPIVIERAMNEQLIPLEYHAILLAVVLPTLSAIGRKIKQDK